MPPNENTDAEGAAGRAAERSLLGNCRVEALERARQQRSILRLLSSCCEVFHIVVCSVVGSITLAHITKDPG